MRRTIRGRGARGFADARVPNVPGADVGGSPLEFWDRIFVVREELYSEPYAPATESPLLCLQRPVDE